MKLARVLIPARTVAVRLGALTVLAITASCAQILGLGDYRDLCKPDGLGDPPDCVYADAGVPTGSGGNGGEPMCEPGSRRTCYDGPGGPTAKVQGLCQKGEQTCDEEGDAYGECKGEVLPKIESCASKDDENCDGLDCIEWNDHWKPSSEGDIAATCVAVDPTTHAVMVAGLLSGAATFPGKMLVGIGKGDAFVARLDSDGRFVKAELFGDAGFDNVQACALDRDRNLILGGVSDTGFMLGKKVVPAGIFVLKLTPELEPIWIKSIGGTNKPTAVGPTAVSADPAGDIIISGYFTGTLALDDGTIPAINTLDSYILKMGGKDGATSKESSGDIWLQTLAGDDDLENNLVSAVDSSGSVLFAATFTNSMSLFGKSFASNGAGDIAFGKVSTRGVPIWTRQIGDASDERVSGIAVDGEGALLAKGSFIGALSLPGGPMLSAAEDTPFIFRWQTTDDPSWARSFEPGAALTFATDKADVVISARFRGSFDFGAGCADRRKRREFRAGPAWLGRRRCLVSAIQVG